MIQYFPDITITADDAIFQDDQAVLRWRYREVYREGEMIELEATGRRVDDSGITRRIPEAGGRQAVCGGDFALLFLPAGAELY